MKKLMLGALLIGVVGIASAQGDGWRRNGERGRGNGAWGYGNSSYGAPGFNVVNRAMRNLDAIASRSYTDKHERDHFRKALDALNQFQRDSQRGKFNKGSLDRAIDNIKDLAQADQLNYQARNVLQRDLQDLRAFRDGGYGNYRNGYPGGYPSFRR